VPPAIVVGLPFSGPHSGDEAAALAMGLAALGGAGGQRWLVRSALGFEDGDERSAAGLGRSLAVGPHPEDAAIPALLAALDHVSQAARSTEAAVARLVAGTGGGDPPPPGPLVSGVEPGNVPRGAECAAAAAAELEPDGTVHAAIVQQCVDWELLLALAVAPGTASWIEVHRRGDTTAPLDVGVSPSWAGPLARWEAPQAPQVHTLLAEILRQGPSLALTSAHGAEFELLIDRRGCVWVVQARPLLAELQPDSVGFFAAAEQLGGGAQLLGQGTWELDAEHNPEPVSPLHAWLVEQLAGRPDAGPRAPRAVAGWLYVPGAPARPEGGAAATETVGVAAAEEPVPAAIELAGRLLGALIPAARARARALAQRANTAAVLPTPSERGHELAACLEAAVQHVAATIAEHRAVGRALPSRSPGDAAALPTIGAERLTAGHAAGLGAYAMRWDVAAAIVEGAGAADDAASAVEPDAALRDLTIPAAIAAVREWDDALFAWGLEGFRAVALATARGLSLTPDELFWLGGDQLIAALRGAIAPPLLREESARQRARWTAPALARPPLRVIDGQPAPALSADRLRGAPIGDSRRGPLAVRRDWEHAEAAPPPRGAIVALPTLTAQAALWLASRRGDELALCTETGGLLSHGAVLAREFGLSALIGCRGCTALPDGCLVELDAITGRLRRVPATATPRVRP
jgi:phosphohistidine swiveling domain-containing protein